MDDRKFGDILSERRRRLNVSIDQAVSATKLRPQVLEAFERSDFSSMPPKGYAQGMLSSYARFLRLDPREVLDPYFDQLYTYERERDFQARSERIPRYESPDQISRRRSASTREGFSSEQRSSFDDTHVVYTSAGRPSSSSRARSSAGGSDRSYGNVYSRYSSRRSQNAPRTTESYHEEFYDADGEYFDSDDRGYTQSSSARRRSSQDAGSRKSGSRRSSSSQLAALSRSLPAPIEALASRLPFSRELNLVALAAGVLLVVILVLTLTVRGCTKKPEPQTQNQNLITPVTAQVVPQNSQATTPSQNQQQAANSQQSQQQTTTQAPQGINVSVSVADGKSAYVEVHADDKVLLSETVKGPKTESYTAKNKITISTSDPKAVTVTRDGEKQAFKTTSGVGVISIQLDENQNQSQTAGANSSNTQNSGQNTHNSQESAQSSR